MTQKNTSYHQTVKKPGLDSVSKSDSESEEPTYYISFDSLMIKYHL
ncbi:MAG: hypothetical protein J6Y02_10200 [Pseudobutyrivibrio sp.]|nr:hypothetical protein [Pseudobutyrivibrio sp.]